MIKMKNVCNEVGSVDLDFSTKLLVVSGPVEDPERSLFGLAGQERSYTSKQLNVLSQLALQEAKCSPECSTLRGYG